jgi:hypothetical protein
VHDLPLKLKLGGAALEEVEELFVDFGTRINEVELMRFVLGACALTADALFVIEAEELELELRVLRAEHLRDREVI